MRFRCKKIFLIIIAVSAIGAVGHVTYISGSLRAIQKNGFKNLQYALKSEITRNFHHRSDELSADSYNDISFGSDSFRLTEDSELHPDLNASYLAKHKHKIEEFLQWRLLDHKHETNLLAPLLPTHMEIIREIHRVQFNLFEDLIGKFKYAMLFDVAAFENKGDPAISAGQVYLIRRLGIQIIFYCNCNQCIDEKLQYYAENMSKRYSTEELVILFQGGGNLVGYVYNDILRGTLIPRFKGFKMVIFSQSVYVPDHIYGGKHFEYCRKLYCCNPDLTIVLRDKQSLQTALKYWNNGTNIVLAPDMAFQIGPVRRFMSPSYDILWLKRIDGEAPTYASNTPMSTRNVTVCVADWWGWETNKGKTTMETAFTMTNNGFVFLQRGRVVITDRLHGHILSTLLNIPHIIIDNQYKKLSSYHNTWTRSLNNVLMTSDSSEALELALTLLEKYDDVLPPIAPVMEVEEYKIRK